LRSRDLLGPIELALTREVPVVALFRIIGRITLSIRFSFAIGRGWGLGRSALQRGPGAVIGSAGEVCGLAAGM